MSRVFDRETIVQYRDRLALSWGGVRARSRSSRLAVRAESIHIEKN
jgi:hypothetical protein